MKLIIIMLIMEGMMNKEENNDDLLDVYFDNSPLMPDQHFDNKSITC